MGVVEAKNFMIDAGIGITGSVAERAMCALAVSDIKRRLSPNHEAQRGGANQLPGRQSIKLREGEYTLTFNLPSITTDTDVITSDLDPTVVTGTVPFDRTIPQAGTPIYQATQLSREDGGLLVTQTKKLHEPRLSFQLEIDDVSLGYIISGNELYLVMKQGQNQPHPDENDLVVIKTPHAVTSKVMGLVLRTLAHGIEENQTLQ